MRSASGFGCFLLLTLLAGVANAACFDVRKGEPQELQGILSHRVFAGPPNYEDVSKGDQPEPGYLLKLDKAICLTGDADFTDPNDMFDEVQLVPGEGTEDGMQKLLDSQVTVKLENPMPAHTGHHHRPLVAWVAEIAPR